MSAIEVELFTFREFAFEPGDISFGDGETKDVIINSNGKLNKEQSSNKLTVLAIALD